MESKNMVLMNLFSGQQEKQTYRTDLWTWGEGRGLRVRYKESNMEIYNSMCKIDSNRNLLYDSGTSNRGSVTIWKVGWRERWERGLGGKGHECTYG